MRADTEGMQRLGIDPSSIIGVRVAECGFDPYERDDGLHGLGPDGRYDPQVPRYNRYLNDKGYAGDNPWHDWANAAQGEGNRLASGWAMRHARKPARVREEDSETPYMTRRAMDFIAEAGDAPWCLHLSYIKPHWPYIAPAPYNAMYGPDDVLPVVRSEDERSDPHPVYREFMDAARQPRPSHATRCATEVIPVYMGLIKQIDDQLGRAVPLPGAARPVREHHDRLHLRPRRLSGRPLDGREGPVPRAVREGAAHRLRSLGRGRWSARHGRATRWWRRSTWPRPSSRRWAPIRRASRTGWRAARSCRFLRGAAPAAMAPLCHQRVRLFAAAGGGEARCRAARRAPVHDRRRSAGSWSTPPASGRCCTICETDPNEFRDLGADPACEDRAAPSDGCAQRLGAAPLPAHHASPTQQIRDRRGKSQRRGILIGVWDESDVPDELWSKYLGEEQ